MNKINIGKKTLFSFKSLNIISVIVSDCQFVGVDTEEDLKRVNEIYREAGGKFE